MEAALFISYFVFVGLFLQYVMGLFEDKGYRAWLGVVLLVVLGPFVLLVAWFIPEHQSLQAEREREAEAREWALRMREQSLEKRVQEIEERAGAEPDRLQSGPEVRGPGEE